MRLNRSQLFFLAHLIICSFSLIFLVHNAAVTYVSFWSQHLNSLLNYNLWAKDCIALNKPSQLSQYIATLFVIFIYYIFAYSIFTTRFGQSWVAHFNTTKRALIYFGIAIALNLLFFLFRHSHFSIVLVAVFSLMWLITLFLPTFPTALSYQFPRLNPIAWPLLGLIILLTCSIFFPYFKGNHLKVSNDYLNIPEQTLLNKQYVDNINFINDRDIGNLTIYDPRILDSNKQPQPLSGKISVSADPGLLAFIKLHPGKFYYNNLRHQLIIKGNLTLSELQQIINTVDKRVDIDNVNNYFYQYQSNLKKYTPLEIQFVKLNQYELINQAIAGHYFHHHNEMIGSINDYLLGKPLNQTQFLYGWLNTIGMAHLMQWTGHVNFQTYIKVLYSFYPIYYFLFAVVAWLIFKDIWITLVVTLLTYAALQLMGFELIRIAPGLNPLRHFFDLFVIYFFWKFLSTKKAKDLYLILSLAFSLITILANKEFGLIIFGAIVTTFLIYLLKESHTKLRYGIILLVAIIGALVALFIQKSAADPTALYSLLGVSVAPTPNSILYFFLTLINLVYAFYFYLFAKSETVDFKWLYMSLFLFFYSQGILIYYIWYTEPGHLLSVFCIFALFIGTLFKVLPTQWPNLQKYQRSLAISLSLAIFILLYIPSLFFYYRISYSYNKIFQTHHVYQWNFPRAQFLTTMDPAPFQNSIDLINKYATGNGIYLISKYDNLIPFLAAKYNLMPYNQMDLTLVTDKETKTAEEFINFNKPTYIFVDTDINNNHINEIYSPDDFITKSLSNNQTMLFAQSRGRALVLDNLSHFFKTIQNDYVPIETGNLLTVYRRKNNI